MKTVSSSGTPSASPPHSPRSDGNDQRKRKRMQSNRESARRSRIRKQKHLENLTAEAARLSKENGQIVSSIDVTTQHYVRVEAENSVLRAQMMVLSQRLQSLDDILNGGAAGGFEVDKMQFGDGWLNSSWNVIGQQPIMAAAEIMFDYY